jgi:hypothetical protein
MRQLYATDIGIACVGQVRPVPLISPLNELAHNGPYRRDAQGRTRLRLGGSSNKCATAAAASQRKLRSRTIGVRTLADS